MKPTRRLTLVADAPGRDLAELSRGELLEELDRMRTAAEELCAVADLLLGARPVPRRPDLRVLPGGRDGAR